MTNIDQLRQEIKAMFTLLTRQEQEEIIALIEAKISSRKNIESFEV